MDKLRAIIIEDEELARNLLKKFLSEFTQIELVAECTNGFDGVKSINELKPDLIFLDVQMPKLTGFEMLELLDFMPHIIFTTAYNQFAIKAFEYNTIYYLLKPFSFEKFEEAIMKAIKTIENKQYQNAAISGLIEHVNNERETLDRIVVKNGSKIKIIPISEIYWIEAADDYVVINTEKEEHIKQATMRFFEDNLNEKDFIRIHRSSIVRINKIAEIEKYEKETYLVTLQNGKKVKASKRYYPNLRETLNL